MARHLSILEFENGEVNPVLPRATRALVSLVSSLVQGCSLMPQVIMQKGETASWVGIVLSGELAATVEGKERTHASLREAAARTSVPRPSLAP